jgi:hypothetical protein
MRETFGESCPYRYAILDRDGKYGQEVIDLLTASAVMESRKDGSEAAGESFSIT